MCLGSLPYQKNIGKPLHLPPLKDGCLKQLEQGAPFCRLSALRNEAQRSHTTPPHSPAKQILHFLYFTHIFLLSASPKSTAEVCGVRNSGLTATPCQCPSSRGARSRILSSGADMAGNSFLHCLGQFYSFPCCLYIIQPQKGIKSVLHSKDSVPKRKDLRGQKCGQRGSVLRYRCAKKGF